MRNHLPRIGLLAALALAAACGPNGPATRSGLTSCDQLRECACDPSRTSDVDACNSTVDNFETSADPDRTCTLQLQISGCGRGLQVLPPVL